VYPFFFFEFCWNNSLSLFFFRFLTPTLVGIISGKTLNEIAKESGHSSWSEIEDRDNLQDHAVVLAGSELPALTDADWDFLTKQKELVFARTSPEQKFLIVDQVLKKKKREEG
jgi:sodium/potassium-transporting ATPase subunit alpha